MIISFFIIFILLLTLSFNNSDAWNKHLKEIKQDILRVHIYTKEITNKTRY